MSLEDQSLVASALARLDEALLSKEGSSGTPQGSLQGAPVPGAEAGRQPH